jgi:hypothetical protein
MYSGIFDGGSRWLEVGDVNGDGFDDIVLSNQNQTLGLSVYGGASLNGSTVFTLSTVHTNFVNLTYTLEVRSGYDVELSVSAPNGASSVFYDDMSIGGGMQDIRLLRGSHGIQIGMDENGNVTNANIVRSITTDSGCLMAEDLESTNKDDGDEPEDESSNVLVAAGGVEVTTRDAAVAGVAAVTTALLSAVIRGGGGVLTRGKPQQ